MNKCHICGQEAVALANHSRHLCEKHACELAVQSIKEGNPVLMAVQGEFRYMLLPELVKVNTHGFNVN